MPERRTNMDRDEARAQLKQSVDTLVRQTNLQLRMQQEPLKMLGGATGVGVALGVLVGRNFRRSRRVYVDAASSKKEQKALAKAQGKKGGGLGNALIATVATIGFRVLQERVIAPRLGELADRLLEQSKQNGTGAGSTPPASSKSARPEKGPGEGQTVDLSKR